MRSQWDEIKPIPDWSRIILKFTPSVGAGHFCNDFLSAEIRDAAITLNFSADELTEKSMRALAAKMNTSLTPEADAPFLILTTGDWGQHSQRHFLQYALRQLHWMQKTWGVAKAAQDFKTTLAPLYTNLELFPALGFESWELSSSEEKASASKLKQLATQEPWKVVARRWLAAEEEGFVSISSPSAKTWFARMTPFGTQYNVYNRRMLSLSTPFSGQELKQARAMAPYDLVLANYRSAEIVQNGEGSSVFEKEMGTMTEYIASIARGAAELVRDDPEKFIKASRRAIAILPDLNSKLGDYLIELKRFDEAAECYQAMLDYGTAHVSASYDAAILVHYYLDKKQPAKAKAAAEYGAKVYSYVGLGGMVDFCIRTGDAEGAVEWAKKTEERYNNNGLLMLACASFPQLANEHGYPAHIRELFPNGMNKVTLDFFKGEPAGGAVFVENSRLLKSNGLTDRDVVVVAQGYLVENDMQYIFARDLNPGLSFKLIVWDGSSYREVEAIAPQRRFGVELAPYRG
jgi:tetratricopeptide (TPR) repeat protein